MPQKREPDYDLWQNLGANLLTLLVIAIIAYVAAPQIHEYITSVLPDPPIIKVEPSDVDVQIPDQTEVIERATSQKLSNLDYYELSLLLDAEMNGFTRMYNHYQQNRSDKLKALIVEQANRIDRIMAFREEAWVIEARDLGYRQDDFAPLKPVITDILDGMGIDTENGDAGGSGEPPKLEKGQ